MNNHAHAVPVSYANIDWNPAQITNTQHWDPGFDAERCLVYSKFGPYRRLYEKPAKFTRWFFHTLYPLEIEHWSLSEQLSLYDDFCTITVDLSIRFQVTTQYIKQNAINPAEANAYIKAMYERLIRDIAQDHLLNLTDVRWVKTGVQPQEQAIELAVNELFLGQDIQASCQCDIKPFFQEFPDIKFKEEAIYLMAMKKNFEIVCQKQQQAFLEAQILEQQKLEQEQQRFALIKQQQELELQRLALEAEHEKNALIAREQHLLEKLAAEKRLHEVKLKHETELHDLAVKEQLNRQLFKEAQERDLELQLLNDKLSHQQTIKEQQLTAKIKAFEQEKSQWLSAKAQWQAEELKIKQQQRQIEIDAEVASQAYLQEQQNLLEERSKPEKKSWLSR